MDEVTLHPLFLRNPEGMTVKQLKGQLAQWPDEDELGQPLRVYVYFDAATAVQCAEMVPLDLTPDGEGDGHLLLLPRLAGVETLEPLPPAES